MKKFSLRGLKAGLIGVLIGFIISIIVSIQVGSGVYYPVAPQLINVLGNELNAVILQTIVSFLYGGFFGCVSLIWEKDEWSILRQTLTHFSLVVVVTFPIAYFMHWLQRTLTGIIIYFSIFSIIYFGIWLALYLQTKHQITKMNKKIKEDNI